MESVTWTISLSLSLLNDLVNNILTQLNESSRGINRTKIFRGEKSAQRRDELLTFLQNIGYVTISNPRDSKNAHMFEITEKGRYYINLESDMERRKQFHVDMQEIFWYEFAYRKIITMDIDEFSRGELLQHLAVESEKECLINRYDGHSFDNVICCFLFTGVIETDNGVFKITDNYKSQFDEQRFLHEIEQIIKIGERKYTIDVCNHLVKKRRNFIASQDILAKFTITEALKKLLKFENKKFRFVGGIPKPPIPAKQTIIERIG